MSIELYLWYAFMSENKQEQKATGIYKQAICPRCGERLNLASKRHVNFSLPKADSRVRCKHCGDWVKFSIDDDTQ